MNIYNPTELTAMGLSIYSEDKKMINKTHFLKTIIRAYDIRGIYNKTIFDLDAKIIVIYLITY